MDALKDLYQDTILRHGRHSLYEGHIPSSCITGEGTNPRCGDEIQIHVHVEDGIIREARFTGQGCLVSRASASLLCEAVTGQTVTSAMVLRHYVNELLQGKGPSTDDQQKCGDLVALSAVAGHPARHRCVTLAWSALVRALEPR